jgi:hypothetical protein
MKLISHRGNLNGPEVSSENLPASIEKVINLGFDCEIDFWCLGKKYFLGHDKPENEINLSFLNNYKDFLWVHCKNLEGLNEILNLPFKIGAFWHQSDYFTLTTNGYIWTFPGQPTTRKSILVNLDQEVIDLKQLDVYGICSDYIQRLI